VLVCTLFNFMNRMVEGLGIRADEGYAVTPGRRLREGGYAGAGRAARLLTFVDSDVLGPGPLGMLALNDALRTVNVPNALFATCP
jgi:hypothetical protein